MTAEKPPMKPLPFSCVKCDPGEEAYYRRKQLAEHLPDGKYICLSCGEVSEVKTIDRPRRRR